MANDPTTQAIPSDPVPETKPKHSPAPAAAPVAAAPAPADVALDVWCGEKSRNMGKRVEALSAFYRLTQRKGIGRATPEQFEADFQAFLKTPV